MLRQASSQVHGKDLGGGEQLSQGESGVQSNGGRQTYPVSPDPPATDFAPGQHETALHKDEHEHQGATSIGHHQVARNGPYGPEDADGQVVDQEQQQPAHKKPASTRGCQSQPNLAVPLKGSLDVP